MTFVDNQNVLDLIEAKRPKGGLLPMLDDQLSTIARLAPGMFKAEFL